MNRKPLYITTLSIVILLTLVFIIGELSSQNTTSLTTTLDNISATTQTAALGDLTSGLVAHYTFDEGSGTTAADSSGNSNTATLINSPTWVAGKFGQGLKFVGNNSYVDAGNPSSLNFDRTDPFSIFVWVNQDEFSGYAGIVQKELITYPGWALGVRSSPSVFEFGMLNNAKDGGITVRWPRASTGVWHLIGITYDGSSSASGVTVYTDGVPASKTILKDNLTSGSIVVSGPLKIGVGYSSLYPYHGSIDDARIYNRPLSSQEVADLYAQGSTSSGGSNTGDTGGTSDTGGTTGDTSANNNTDSSNNTDNTSPTPVNGTCGPAATTYTSSATFPQGSYCTQSTPSPTTPSNPSAGSSSTWSCTGSNDGTSASCTATRSPVPQTEPPPTTTNLPPAGAQVIGKEALVEFPSAALWNTVINFQPGNFELDNKKLQLNPPIFSWPYDPTMDPVTYSPSRKFWLQVDDSSDFSSPVVNVSTEYNLYTFLKPFTSNQKYYWRVGYLTKGQSSPSVWSSTRTFIIDAGAVMWDRSGLADNAYINSKIGSQNHPYILFNVSNRKALYQFVDARLKNYLSNNIANDVNNIGKSWHYMKSYADRDIASTWWNVSHPTGVAISTRAHAVMNVAIVWQLTKEAPAGSADAELHNRIQTADPGKMLQIIAQDYIDDGTWKVDVVSNSGYSIAPDIGFAYDWLYEILSDEQRAVSRKSVELFASWVMDYSYRSGGIRVISDIATWNLDPVHYSGDYQVLRESLFKRGHSHTFDNFYSAVKAVLAVAGESSRARSFMDFSLNYFIGKGSPYNYGNGAINQGRLYGSGNAISPLYANILYQLSFPEIHFEKNPYLREGAEWWSRTLPIGFVEVHQPWGDGGNSGDALLSRVEYGRDVALFLQDTRLMNQWNKVFPQRLTGLYEGVDFVMPFYYQPPNSTVTTNNNSRLYDVDGWATACSVRYDSGDCFKNGVGFSLMARPAGQLPGSHASFGDLSYQLWAYGTTITDAGGAYHSTISSTPLSQYTLLINGLGQAQARSGQTDPYVTRFFAYKESSDYVYAAIDATNAYPKKSFAAGAMDATPTSYLTLHSGGPLKDLQKVRRHFVFVKNKYFVVFDDLSMSQPAIFSSLYPILEDRITFSDSQKTSFKYLSNVGKITQTNTAPDINVFVSQLHQPSNIRVDDMTGGDLYKNPFISSENYSYTGGDTKERTHALWFSNRTPATSFHFLTVIYPKNPADDTAGKPDPKIERLDDYTAKVTNPDGTVDVISFNNNPQATIAVDLSQLTPLPVVDDVTGTTVTSVPYVPPPSNPPPTTPPSTTLPGDFDHNNIVNSLDLSLLTSKWNQSNTTFDLTGDGLINTLDYVVMVKNWTR